MTLRYRSLVGLAIGVAYGTFRQPDYALALWQQLTHTVLP